MAYSRKNTPTPPPLVLDEILVQRIRDLGFAYRSAPPEGEGLSPEETLDKLKATLHMLPGQVIIEALTPVAVSTDVPKPQSGPQTDFLNSEADIVIFGGAAGGGKSFALFLEAVKDRDIAGSSFVYFRRQQTDISKQGGPWEKSMLFFPLFGAEPNKTSYKWRFPNGAGGQFASLQFDQDVLNWHSAEIDLLCFDELTHYTEHQFWYMLSRNRSALPTKKRIRAGTNPDGGSWVKKLIAPWVDDDWNKIVYNLNGISYEAKPAKTGELRYIARNAEGEIVWVDKDWRYPANESGFCASPKSITFIASKLSDNKALTDADPEYESNLLMQDAVNSARLLRGDWSVMSGSFFSEWMSDTTHLITAEYTEKLPTNWLTFGGMDANGISKQAFTLCATDEYGSLHVVESIYSEGKTPIQFSADVCAVLGRWSLSRKNVPIAADPAMFTDNSRRDSVGEADIEVYHRAGLRCFQANNNRIHGWARVHEWLQRVGKFHIWRGYNDELIKQFPNMKADPTRPGDMLKKDMVDDPHDSLRYAIMTRPRPAGLPESAKTHTPEDVKKSIGQMSSDWMSMQMMQAVGMMPKKLPGSKDEFERDDNGNLVFEKRGRAGHMKRPLGS